MQWALMICVPALLNLKISGYEGQGVLLIAYLVIMVQLSDVLQYVCGKLIGRQRIAPTCLPPKRWKVSLAVSCRQRPGGTKRA